jgi:hypothetical protein
VRDKEKIERKNYESLRNFRNKGKEDDKKETRK